MKIEDRSALINFNSKQHVLLKVEGKGKEQHLVAKHKGFLGRLWIDIKLGLGISSSYSLSKVADYVKKNMDLNLDNKGDIALIHKLDNRLVTYSKKQQKRRPSFGQIVTSLKIIDVHEKLSRAVSQYELNDVFEKIKSVRETKQFTQFFGLDPNYRFSDLDTIWIAMLKHFNPDRYTSSQRDKAIEVYEGIIEIFTELKSRELKELSERIEEAKRTGKYEEFFELEPDYLDETLNERKEEMLKYLASTSFPEKLRSQAKELSRGVNDVYQEIKHGDLR